jgi:hypothetical protein
MRMRKYYGLFVIKPEVALHVPEYQSPLQFRSARH